MTRTDKPRDQIYIFGWTAPFSLCSTLCISARHDPISMETQRDGGGVEKGFGRVKGLKNRQTSSFPDTRRGSLEQSPNPPRAQGDGSNKKTLASVLLGIKSTPVSMALHLENACLGFARNQTLLPRSCDGIVVRLLASHLGETSSIPSSVAPGFSHVGIVSDDASGRWVFFLGMSRFLRPYIPALLPTHLVSPSSALKTAMLRAAQISPLHSKMLLVKHRKKALLWRLRVPARAQPPPPNNSTRNPFPSQPLLEPHHNPHQSALPLTSRYVRVMARPAALPSRRGPACTRLYAIHDIILRSTGSFWVLPVASTTAVALIVDNLVEPTNKCRVAMLFERKARVDRFCCTSGVAVVQPLAFNTFSIGDTVMRLAITEYPWLQGTLMRRQCHQDEHCSVQIEQWRGLSQTVQPLAFRTSRTYHWADEKSLMKSNSDRRVMYKIPPLAKIPGRLDA
ncbi:hypothetical protein PR048_008856 [Dryococelus australis]|uniref:Uncharacterized protein n=1 Tax=Dryococelus australis TaxID=614101 RepID=A0ABQ9HYN1_9NEOP|nr:hypothetical protein PR048_008856 [Dryococelus australis]